MTNDKQSTPDTPETEGSVEGVVEEGVAQGEAPGHEELTLLLEDARSKADEHNAHKYALEKFAQELLPVKDSLEMGLAAASGEVDAAEALKQLREPCPCRRAKNTRPTR